MTVLVDICIHTKKYDKVKEQNHMSELSSFYNDMDGFPLLNWLIAFEY